MATELVLIRHGETEWSRTRRHTSHTDLPLTDRGREAAATTGKTLENWTFTLALSSPRLRARDTAALALPYMSPELTEDLTEWNYGDYEGITTTEIHDELDPGWDLWLDGCPNGESPKDVAARVDRVIERLNDIEGSVACFAHGHVLRVLAARWIGLGPDAGAFLALDTASISVLGREHARRVIHRWNSPV